MAVYYIDPYTTVNGTGTWASPFSLNSASRGGTLLSSGDEVRLVAKYLTSILTATTYTANRASVNTITLTSGGGLGADFVVGDFVYFPDYDSFARVNAKSTNTLTLASSSLVIPVPTSEIISLNVRKLDTTVATPSSTTTPMYTWAEALQTSLDGVTFSDGWVADGVRVTDGTAKSIVRSSTTGTSGSWYLDINVSQSQDGPPARNSTADLRHTHFVGNNASVSTLTTYCYAFNTVNINQLYCSNGTSTSFVTTSGGTGGRVPSAMSLTFKHCSILDVIATKSTMTITNLYLSNTFRMPSTFYDGTLTITNVLLNTLATTYLAATSATVFGAYNTCNVGLIDIYTSAAPSAAITGQPGGYTLNIAGAIYTLNRIAPQVSAPYRFALSTSSFVSTPLVNLPLPKINTTGITYTSEVGLNQIWTMPANSLTLENPIDIPAQYEINSYHPTTQSQVVGYLVPVNILVTHGDGTAPYEVLGLSVATSSATAVAAASATLPVVTTDATVYRTAGPSIKAYLGSYSTPGYWITGWSTKTIKIPVVSGTSYTVSGYVRTDQTTFVSGEAVVSIVNRYGVVASQSMTTACINAWEGFSLSFAASQTEELYLSFRMRFSAGAKAFWLDDLTIV